MTDATRPPASPGQGPRREAERLYERARALPPEERAAFLDDACRDDPRLCEELRSLVDEADRAEAFFERLTDRVFADPDSIVEAVLQGSGPGAGPSGVSPDLPPGRTVGHFRIVERIGAGGMGTVYRARDTRLDRDVALKFLPPDLGAGRDDEERLLVEARAAAALEHPNVCTVHEVGETEDGRSFIAMALYPGETLKERIRKGPLPPEDAAAIAIQIARGLAAAHERGIVHRDIKPGNVILTADGTVKLLDFGLARLAEATLTLPGATPGTVAYMSPEQTRGDPLDRRTDLWSLGVVLYEMLAGLRPFRGGNDRAVIQAIRHAQPEPLGKRRPGTPEALQRIVDRLLRKEREARYASAGDVVADLERARQPGAGTSRGRTIRRRRLGLATGAALALAGLAGIGLWLSGRGEEAGPPAVVAAADRPSIAVLPFANLGADPGDGALADGMTQELIGILARNQNLRVIASTSVFVFRNSSTDVRRIADSLGVSHIVEGSLQKIGDRLRMQIRLVDAGDGSTRWSETYDREFRDVFTIQEDISRAVAVELDARLAGDPDRRLQRHQTSSVAAYEFYLRGSDDTLRRSESGLRQGIEYLKQAIAADSTYAAPYAALARLYMNLGNRSDPVLPVGALHDLAEQAALKAIALDDSLAEGHASLGFIRWFVTHDLVAAESELRRAITVDPTHSLSHAWLAQLYIRIGRPAEALAEARLALENDPLSPIANAEVAHALLANGRYDEALARLGSVAQLQPPLYRVARYRAQAYAMKGRWEDALEALGPRLGDDVGTNSDPLDGYLLARSGRREAALQIRETVLDRVRNGTRGAFDMVVVETGLGDFDQAFAWLDRAIDDRSTEEPTFHIMEPIFNELRADPRFEAFQTRLGIQNR